MEKAIERLPLATAHYTISGLRSVGVETILGRN